MSLLDIQSFRTGDTINSSIFSAAKGDDRFLIFNSCSLPSAFDESAKISTILVYPYHNEFMLVAIRGTFSITMLAPVALLCAGRHPSSSGHSDSVNAASQ
jgi:hypothetical protein